MAKQSIPRQPRDNPTLIRALARISDTIAGQAKALGMHRQALSAILAGQRPLSAELAAEIARRSKIPLKRLRPDLFDVPRGGSEWPAPHRDARGEA